MDNNWLKTEELKADGYYWLQQNNHLTICELRSGRFGAEIEVIGNEQSFVLPKGDNVSWLPIKFPLDVPLPANTRKLKDKPTGIFDVLTYAEIKSLKGQHEKAVRTGAKWMFRSWREYVRFVLNRRLESK